MVIETRTDIRAHRSGEKKSDQQIVGFLGRKIYQAMNDEDGDLSDTRQNTLERYLGQLYGNERDGYSKFTTREMMETIEWVLPSVLRVFVSGDRVVSFDPVGAEDEEQAKQETDVVNYRIMKANDGDGFLAIHDFIKDALLFPNSYIKAYVEEEKTTRMRHVTEVPPEALEKFIADENIKILEQDSSTIKMPMPVPNPDNPNEMIIVEQDVEVFELRYRETKKERKTKIMPIPGEEALVDNDLTTLNLDHGDFVCHRVRKSYSELVRLGYDQDKLDDVGTYEDYQWNDERTSRLFYEDENPDSEDEDDPSMRQFWVHDCYVWIDTDGDGLAEYRRIVLIGSVIFDNEEVDYQPMVAMSSILMPHKHNGMSLGDIVKDLQELNTVLTRQLLDNIYKINIRRKYISEDSLIEDGTTMEAMLNVQSEWIPVRGIAQNAVQPETTQSMLGEILPILEHNKDKQKLRSGVAPDLSLDPEVLQQATMGAFMGALEQASQRIEMLVRIMAETGFKQLARKMHQLCRMYPDIATTIKLRGEWVDVDPQHWQERTDLTVNAGLGFNTKQTMIGILTQLLTIQKEAMPAGLAAQEELFNTLEQLIDSMNIGNVERYFKDPLKPDWQPPQPQPDPQMILAQAQAQALESEQQRKGFEAQSRVEVEKEQLRQAGVKSQLDAQSKQMDNQHKRQTLVLDTRKADIAEREILLKEREMDVREAEALAGIDNIHADSDLKAATSVKHTVEALGSVAEISENYQEARRIVEEDVDNGDGEIEETPEDATGA